VPYVFPRPVRPLQPIHPELHALLAELPVHRGIVSCRLRKVEASVPRCPFQFSCGHGWYAVEMGIHTTQPRARRVSDALQRWSAWYARMHARAHAQRGSLIERERERSSRASRRRGGGDRCAVRSDAWSGENRESGVSLVSFSSPENGNAVVQRLQWFRVRHSDFGTVRLFAKNVFSRNTAIHILRPYMAGSASATVPGEHVLERRDQVPGTFQLPPSLPYATSPA
jgi:hypothetical protein